MGFRGIYNILLIMNTKASKQTLSGHWHDAQDDERSWWADCVNTYWEETKQLEYAKLIDIEFAGDERSPFTIDLKGKSVLDIGGGPASLLLKTINGKQLVVADPCEYPAWIATRYKAYIIKYVKVKGEDIPKHISDKFDEVWMYNVLQHTDSPPQIIKNAFKSLKPHGKFRFFDWINTPTNAAHPHSLTSEELDKWIGQPGKNITMNQNGCYGQAFYGVFTK